MGGMTMLLDFWPVWVVMVLGAALCGWAFWFVEGWKLTLSANPRPYEGEPARVLWHTLHIGSRPRIWQAEVSGKLYRLHEFQ